LSQRFFIASSVRDGLKAVVGRNQLEHPALTPPASLTPCERDVDSELDVLAVFLRAAALRMTIPSGSHDRSRHGH